MTTMGSTDRLPRSVAETRYRALLEEQAKSGLTLREFARRRGIPPGTLSCWRFKLRARGADRPRTPVPAPMLLPVRVVPASVRTTVAPAQPSSGYEVLLRCGRVIRVSEEFGAESLTRLVRTLEATC